MMAVRDQRKLSGKTTEEPEVARRLSPRLLALFRWYLQRYLKKHFHQVLLSQASSSPENLAGPLVVVLNHPSWWDPLVCLQLSSRLGKRRHFAPFDAGALENYRFFKRLGAYGVKLGTLKGAATFLKTSLALLEAPDTVLWITAQGLFTDPRQRPIQLMNGIGHLAKHLTTGFILPLALEYPFWHERTPEALARFGQPWQPAQYPELSASEWTKQIAAGLESTQDALAEEACRQEVGAFHSLLQGKTGVGGVFDCWRRFRAILLGTEFRSDHGQIVDQRKRQGI